MAEISEFYEYIWKATEGHVGLVRHMLSITEKSMRKWADINLLTFQKIFTYMNSWSFYTSVNETCRGIPKVDNEHKELWKLCDEVYSNKIHPFEDSDKNAQYLVKTGVLIVVDGYLRF